MIATIENLDGQDAFDYSVDFFNTVTIGNKDEDNGVLKWLTDTIVYVIILLRSRKTIAAYVVEESPGSHNLR